MVTGSEKGAKEVEGTIVFTDIVGFTEFTATRGDVQALELLATQERLVRAALPEAARIVKEIGDGLLLWFGSPVAALQSAFAVDRSFEAESEAAGAPLWLRIGMHHGRVLARGDDLIGHGVTLRRGSSMWLPPVRCSSRMPSDVALIQRLPACTSRNWDPS